MFVGGAGVASIVLLSQSFNLDGTKAEVALARPKAAPLNKGRNASPTTETATANQGADELLARALEEHRAKTDEGKNRQLIATGEVLQLKDDPERGTRAKETPTLTEIEIWNGLELGHAEYLTLIKSMDLEDDGRFHRQYALRLF